MDGVLILALETATGCGSVALTRGDGDNGRVLAEVTVQPEMIRSRRLLGSIQWMLEAAGVDWADLDGIGVSLGPGSFTGLRIGLAAAKGLCLGTGLPLAGICSLDGVALACPVIDRPLWAVLDARKEEVYGACYLPGPGGRPRARGEVLAIRPRDLLARISGPAILAGPGVTVCAPWCEGRDDLYLAPAPLTRPDAARIGLLAAERLAAGEADDPATLAPLYIRASEAELTMQRKQKKDQS